MDRPIARRLTRPRHLVATFLVVLLCAGAAGGVVGFAQASDAPAPITPASFTLATPNVGDRGRYEVVGDAEGGDPILPFGGRSIDFEWLDDVATFELSGDPVWANQVRIRWNGTMLAGGGTDNVYLVRAGSGLAFAMTRAQTEVNEDEDGKVASHKVAQTDWLENRPFQCGFLSLLQGREIDVASLTLRDTLSCANNDAENGNVVSDGSLNPMAIAVTGYQEQDGARYIRVDEYSEPCRCPSRYYWRYFYREDVPYPVRIEGRAGEGSALVLAAFDRGSQPATRNPARDAAAAPAIAFAPRQPWGPDDAGVQHAFPLSAAYKAALDNAEYTALRDFMDGHPAAYTAFAAAHEMREEGTVALSWSFTVTDSKEMLRVSVGTETVDPESAGWPVPLPPPVPPPPVPLPSPGASGPVAPQYTFSDAGVEDATPYEYPAPDALPEQLPTVASMMRRWAVHATPAYQSKVPNFWRMDLSCSFDCPMLDRMVWAGWSSYVRSYPDGADNPPTDIHEESVFTWRRTDFPGRGGELTTRDGAALYETRTQWSHEAATTPVAPPPTSMRPASASAPLVLGGTWAFPDPAAASAVSLGSLVAGFAYFVWPAVKGGAVGLFSRIRGNAVLDNPVRARIAALVEANPGIHYSDLVRQAGKGNGAVDHHLRKLVAAGQVRRVQAKGYTCFFPEGAVDRRAMKAAPLLKSAVARGLVERIRDQPGLTSADAARQLGVTPATLHYHVERLGHAGLVSATPHGATRRLALTADGEHALT